MIDQAVSHLKGQAVGYVALVVALGGTSYAAAALPRNSVGEAQLRTDAVTAVDIAEDAVGGAELDLRSVTPENVGRWPSVAARTRGELSFSGGGLTATLGTPFDPANMHDPRYPQDLTAPVAGTYVVNASVTYSGDAGEISLWREGQMVGATSVGELSSPPAGRRAATVSRVLFLRRGDSMQVRLFAAGNVREGIVNAGMALVGVE